MATLITPSGKVEAITPRNGATFSADEMHELVDGYLECLRLRDGRIMWFDEGRTICTSLLNSHQSIPQTWVWGIFIV